VVSGASAGNGNGNGNGKVVVNRCMSLDGFIAGPGDAMDWVFDFMPGGTETMFPEVMAATGAALIGRRTHEVGMRMSDPDNDEPEPGYDAGALFVLTHEPPAKPYPGIAFLSTDIGDAVATALRAAGGKNLEILGADVAAQCLRAGLVDEILVFVLPVLLGDGVRFFSSPGLDRIDLEPLETKRSGDLTMLRFRVLK
jgi:dihydrofolate reductase